MSHHLRLTTLCLIALIPLQIAAQGVPEPTDLSTLDLTVRHRVRGVLFVPNDRTVPPSIHQRLDTWVRIAQQFFRDEMARYGYLDENGRGKTFVIDEGPDGLWNVVVMIGEHPTHCYRSDQNDRGGAGGECMFEFYNRLPREFHNDNVALYFYDTFGVTNGHVQHSGNGGMGAEWEGEGAGWVLQGTHVFGNGFWTVATDPRLQASIFSQTQPSGLIDYLWDGTRRELTIGEYASTSFGVPIHELGHAFYLDHIFTDTDGDGVENNLMGNGFRRFGGRFGMRGPDAAPTILAPESAAQLNESLMFNQIDPFD